MRIISAEKQVEMGFRVSSEGSRIVLMPPESVLLASCLGEATELLRGEVLHTKVGLRREEAQELMEALRSANDRVSNSRGDESRVCNLASSEVTTAADGDTDSLARGAGAGDRLPVGGIVLACSREEAAGLAAAVDAALTGLEYWEFDTRVGFLPDDAHRLLQRLSALAADRGCGVLGEDGASL